MKTSVALCTYNGENFIGEQLDSILNQSVKPSEIIICDDGSTDNTLKIIGNYFEKNPDIFRVYKNEQNLKIVKNFEKAINLCTNEIIFLCDQDDIWDQNKIESILLFFEKNPDKDAVFHDMKLLKDSMLQNIKLWHTLYFDVDQLEIIPLHKRLIFFENIVTGAALAFRNNTKFEFNNSSNLFLHDYQLAIHFALSGKLGFLNKSLGIYRLHDKQTEGTDIKLRTKRKEHYERFTKNQVLNKLSLLEYKNNFWKILAEDVKYYTVNTILSEEIRTSKFEYLNNLQPLKRKKTLLLWFLKKRFNTTLKELFTI